MLVTLSLLAVASGCGGDGGADPSNGAEQPDSGAAPETEVSTGTREPGTEGATWTRQFGGVKNEEATGLAVDGAGNIYVVGTTAGEIPGQTNHGFGDAWIRKYDTEGNELWTRQYGSTDGSADSGVDAVVDAEGSVYIVGRTSGSLPGATNMGGFDGYLRKYDPQGQDVLTFHIGTEGRDAALRVALDEEGNIYVLGETRGAFPGHTNLGGVDVFLRKHDSMGQELWVLQFGTEEADSGGDLTIDAGGNAYVTGSTFGVLDDMDEFTEDNDVYVTKVDPSGNVLWTHQFGSGADQADEGFAVIVDVDGDVYVGGRVSGELPDGATWGGLDAFIRKYDSDGNTIWSDQIGSDQGLLDNDSAFGLTSDPAGNVYVVGTTAGHLPGMTAFRVGDVWLRKYSSDGEELWTRQFGSDEAEDGLRIALDSDGNLYVVGRTAGELPGLPDDSVCRDKRAEDTACKLRDPFIRKYTNE